MTDREDDATLVAGLEAAIERDMIAPWFQPVMCPGGVEMLSAEALPRWDDPVRGVVPAGVFIDVAIRHGMLARISRILMDKACANFAGWRERGIAPLCVSVNLTGAELRSPESIGQIRDAMEANGLAPEQIAIEIAEAVLTEPGWEASLETVRSLREIGIPFWLDDFGAGPCDAEVIARVDFALAKVDRKIVFGLEEDPAMVERLGALVAQARGAGMRLIAKGVETRGQIDTLVALGCDGQQGYAIARPMAEDAFAEWLDLNTWAGPVASAG